jgi:hypothetical protein
LSREGEGSRQRGTLGTEGQVKRQSAKGKSEMPKTRIRAPENRKLGVCHEVQVKMQSTKLNRKAAWPFTYAFCLLHFAF